MHDPNNKECPLNNLTGQCILNACTCEEPVIPLDTDFFNNLADRLGVPGTATNFKLEVEYGSFPRVTCTYVAIDETGKEVSHSFNPNPGLSKQQKKEVLDIIGNIAHGLALNGKLTPDLQYAIYSEIAVEQKKMHESCQDQ